MGRAYWERIVLPTRSVFQKQRVQGFHFSFVSETVRGKPIGHTTLISPTWLVARTRLFGQYNPLHTDEASAQSIVFYEKYFAHAQAVNTRPPPERLPSLSLSSALRCSNTQMCNLKFMESGQKQTLHMHLSNAVCWYGGLFRLTPIMQQLLCVHCLALYPGHVTWIQGYYYVCVIIC